MGKSLTLKQRKFVRHYVQSGNGTQAALAAYDTTDPKTASVMAVETLGRPSVRQAVAELLDANGRAPEELGGAAKSIALMRPVRTAPAPGATFLSSQHLRRP